MANIYIKIYFGEKKMQSNRIIIENAIYNHVKVFILFCTLIVQLF